MIVLIEDIDVNEKRIKAIDIFHVDDAIIVKTDKNYSESLTLTNARKSKRCVIDDSSDEEKEQNNDNDLFFDNVILSKSSTPRSGKKTCLKPEFYDEIPRIENDSSDPDLEEFKFEHIPELSELSTDTSFDGKERGNGSDKLDGDSKSEELQHDVSPYIAEPEVDGYPLKGSLSAREIISILKHIGDRRTVTSMPDGRKENVYYIVSENNNELRSTTGKRKKYPDDCGVWDSSKGHTVNSYFVFGENNNVKYLSLRDGIYCTEKTISGRKTYERIVPQPSAESVLTLSRYYTTLKRSNQYKRRVSRLQSSDNTQSSFAVVEYTGKYPDEVAPNGNAKHQNTMYRRTNPYILEKNASVARSYNSPRDVIGMLSIIGCYRWYWKIHSKRRRTLSKLET